ncbi:MAG TPA: TetR family transcriptional regulator [Jatrophihabitantaceae bacterium]|nr:TetR family transcriptional regulator [Jatrophihabitantaceae bacterium]
MGRWEPDASGRLREAAMELFLERGYEQTTVADIAERAGLTARTFFRYFADKREVLFGGSAILEARMVSALEAAPSSASPLDAVAAALDAAADMLGERHKLSKQRQAVIAANGELRERELIKMASLSQALANGLRARGVPDSGANLAAETGVAVFRIAFESWVNGPARAKLSDVMHASMEQLRSLTAAD